VEKGRRGKRRKEGTIAVTWIHYVKIDTDDDDGYDIEKTVARITTNNRRWWTSTTTAVEIDDTGPLIVALSTGARGWQDQTSAKQRNCMVHRVNVFLVSLGRRCFCYATWIFQQCVHIFGWNFTSLLSNKTHTLPPCFAEICLKLTKLYSFNHGNPVLQHTSHASRRANYHRFTRKNNRPPNSPDYHVWGVMLCCAGKVP